MFMIHPYRTIIAQSDWCVKGIKPKYNDRPQPLFLWLSRGTRAVGSCQGSTGWISEYGIGIQGERATKYAKASNPPVYGGEYAQSDRNQRLT